MTMQASEKLFLRTVGRWVAARFKKEIAPLIERIDQLETQVREQKAQVRELQTRGVRYCGIYQRAMGYERGDCTTHDGAMWVVIADEAKPMEAPGKSAAWQLCWKAARKEAA
jgi:hypothetical protein